MPRLSRAARIARWTLPLSLAIFVLFQTFCISVFVLQRRMARDLVSLNWRRPTVIVTAAGGREREVVRVYGAEWRITPPVKIGELPPHVPNAFLAAEDVRFRSHVGIDPIGVARAMFRNIRARGITQGGSTIPQQIIKQRFLSQERTWRRKLVEMALAVVLDFRLPKDELLEIYLSEIYLGHWHGVPIHGIDEASRLYFDKPPRALRPDEAAMLAAMIRAPNRDNPEKRPDIVRARRNAILAVMLRRAWIEDEAYRSAIARDVVVTRGSLPEKPYPYYLEALRADTIREVGARKVAAGGLTIVSEMDPAAQGVAERVARRAPASLETRYRWIRRQAKTDPLQVAILSVDPRTGGIRTLVGGSDFHRSAFDRTTHMRRQPGSAFKTFVYLSAIASKRVTPSSLLLDTPVTVKLSDDQTWQPRNYDERFRGRVTLREAFERSLNVPTVRLTQRIGLRRVKNTAEDFGFDHLTAIPALPLGVTEVTMRELTAAYTPFPNLGIRVEPYLLRAVRGRDGKVLFTHEWKSKRVVDAESAYVMHTLLRGVVRRGTANRLKRYDLGYVAGKTGTTNDYRDAWFVGYTADMVTTVWIGFDRGAPLRLSSSEAAIPIWGAYMREIPHTPSAPDPPPGVTFRDIDPESGMLWQDGCPGPIHEVFLDNTAPTHRCPAGIFGRIVRGVLFDDETFDEPAAITFEKFRQWATEADRNRQEVESALEKLRRLFERD